MNHAGDAYLSSIVPSYIKNVQCKTNAAQSGIVLVNEHFQVIKKRLRIKTGQILQDKVRLQFIDKKFNQLIIIKFIKLPRPIRVRQDQCWPGRVDDVKGTVCQIFKI